MPGVTPKLVPPRLPAWVIEPLALTLWDPKAEAGTVKVPLQFPRELAEIPEVTGLPSKVIVMPVSPAPKPEPVTVTELPGGPLAGLTAMVGFTTKVIAGKRASQGNRAVGTHHMGTGG